MIGGVGVKIGEYSELVQEGSMEELGLIDDEDGSDLSVLGEVDEPFLDLADDVDFEEGRLDVEGEGNGLVELDGGAGGLRDIGREELGFAEILDEGSDEGGLARAGRRDESGNAPSVGDIPEAFEGLVEVGIREVLVWLDLRGEGQSVESEEALNLGMGLAHWGLLPRGGLGFY